MSDEDTHKSKRYKGYTFIIIGLIITIIVFLTMWNDFVLLKLIFTIFGLVIIGYGLNISGIILSSKEEEEKYEICYMCNGTGVIYTDTGDIPCPRCGGTGKLKVED